MIDVRCCRCRRELEQKGGVLMMPPSRIVQIGTLEADLVDKLHLCIECAGDVVKFLETPAPVFSCTAPFAPADAACSFCAKRVGEPVSDIRDEVLVRYIIQGPRVTICDACASLCGEILIERGFAPWLLVRLKRAKENP